MDTFGPRANLLFQEVRRIEPEPDVLGKENPRKLWQSWRFRCGLATSRYGPTAGQLKTGLKQ